MRPTVGVPARYRRRAKWLANPLYTLGVKDLGTAVSAFYSGDLRDPAASRWYDLPFYESDDAPATQRWTRRSCSEASTSSQWSTAWAPRLSSCPCSSTPRTTCLTAGAGSTSTGVAAATSPTSTPSDCWSTAPRPSNFAPPHPGFHRCSPGWDGRPIGTGWPAWRETWPLARQRRARGRHFRCHVPAAQVRATRGRLSEARATVLRAKPWQSKPLRRTVGQ